MPKDWILFVPRPKAQAEKTDAKGNSLTGIVDNWQKAKGDKVQVAIGKLEDSQTVDSKYLGDSEVSLYVFAGHCSAGKSYAGWPGNDDNQLQFDILADRIKNLGLDEKSKCKVKIYSCQSGQGNVEDDLNHPFAMRVASALKSKGVTNCTYYGYNYNIDQVYRTPTGIMKMFAGKEDKAMRGPLKELSDTEIIGMRAEEQHRYATQKGIYKGRAGTQKMSF